MIKVRIQGTNGKEYTTTALLDSGASENFIDKAYADTSGIQMQEKTTPRRVLSVDGSKVTGRPVTHHAQIHLTINHHEEDIRLYCITIGNAPIILGPPWLELHDPVIGWKNHTVKFHSDHCAEKCLPSSPRANMVPEEKATEQYYRKTPGNEENWEIGETDPWEVCQTVIDKIKETSKTSENPIRGEYHKFLELFTKTEPMVPSPHRVQDHNIPLEEGKMPLYEPLRPLNDEKMKALKEYLDINEKRGWIRASTSPAGAPIHFVKKKDGGLCLCVNYRQLNEITVKDRTPLPLIGESLDQLSNAIYYTKLDIRDAYYNLRIAKGDEWKTAFRTCYGLYEYCVMPFGLTNASASFQRWMNEILSDNLDIFCVAYLDNILVFSQNEEKQREHAQAILKRIGDTGLMLKAFKCEFHTTETEYLGYVISPQGLRMDEEKIRTIKDWKEPANVKGIQRFLSFPNFYQWFIKDYSKITTPLSSLTSKEKV